MSNVDGGQLLGKVNWAQDRTANAHMSSQEPGCKNWTVKMHVVVHHLLQKNQLILNTNKSSVFYTEVAGFLIKKCEKM